MTIVSTVCRACAGGLTALALFAPGDARAAGPAADACVTCHQQASDARLAKPAADFAGADVHRDSGFACVDCHGGSREATDKTAAHDRTRGFRGAPAGEALVAACARCHSDADLMRKYSPRQRVDQAAEYVTSVHGKRLAAGDTRVATCASCHGAHGVRTVKDARSPVFPTNVAATCGACHADPNRMKGYTLDSGSPLPTRQLADYRQSVHYAALTRGNDLSAPTCNDCHGNHGAVPPGAGSVVNVCGTCHAVFAQKFDTSVHRQIFDRGCVECHGNHAVAKPSDRMLGVDADSICGTCHSGADDKGAVAAQQMRAAIDRLEGGIDRSSTAVARLRNAGMEMSGPELDLASARSQVTLARTEMHAFDPARLTPVVGAGLKLIGDVDAASDRAAAELRYRRRGLGISLAAILLVVVGLGLKIRQVDRRHRSIDS